MNGTSAATLPRRAGAAQTSSAAGDLLLAWAELVPQTPRRRASPSRELASGQGWSLVADETAPGWNGYPLSHASVGDWSVWVLGELAGVGSDRSPAEAIAAELARNGDPALWNGQFLVIARRDSRRDWHAWTDRFGTVHGYHASGGSRAALGTFFPAVAAVASSRRLDGEALCGFLACGFFPADRTFFDDVQILRPASHYVFDERGRRVSEERYAAWRRAPDARRSVPDTAAELAGLLKQVLSELTGSGRVAIPISGGLDSRTTVALLTDAGRPAPSRLWAYTYGYASDSVETAIGRRVGESRGLTVRSLVIGRYLFERLDDVLDAVEGFQDVTQTRQVAVADLLARDADSVVAAHWGDVWLDDMGATRAGPGRDALAEHAFHKVRKRGREWLLREIAAPLVPGEDPEAVARRFVASELKRVGELGDADFEIKAFKTDQWSFRWTVASLRAYRLGALPKLPFYDTRVCGLLLDRAHGLRDWRAASRSSCSAASLRTWRGSPGRRSGPTSSESATGTRGCCRGGRPERRCG